MTITVCWFHVGLHAKLLLGVKALGALLTFEDEDMGGVIKHENEFLFPPTLRKGRTPYACPSMPWDLGQPDSRKVTTKRSLEKEKSRRVGWEWREEESFGGWGEGRVRALQSRMHPCKGRRVEYSIYRKNRTAFSWIFPWTHFPPPPPSLRHLQWQGLSEITFRKIRHWMDIGNDCTLTSQLVGQYLVIPEAESATRDIAQLELWEGAETHAGKRSTPGFP